MKKIVKIINHFVTAVLFIVLISLLFIVISSKASNGSPSIFGYELKSVLSGSMDPIFKTGSIIAIKPGGDRTRFEKGDIITFHSDEGILITHRIYQVKQNGELYITKGDNNNAPDMKPVSADQVIGAYTGFTVPYAGYLVNYAASKNSIVILLLLSGFALVGYAVITIYRALANIDTLKKE